ncbi:hypothetical protein BKA57DRAFT_453988 [Linnemannia elongata]|nr:hypothetical protein BKA57DRAFT_453988 [Linnemannia elongata]
MRTQSSIEVSLLFTRLAMHLNVAIGVPQRDRGLILFLSVTHTFSYALASQLTIGEQLWVRYGIQPLCYSGAPVRYDSRAFFP